MTSTWDELKFYGTLARNLFKPGYDLHKIPGPPGYWGLGHIPKIVRPDYHVQILEWADQYGGIFKISMGCQWVVVVSDPAVAAQVLGRGSESVPRKTVGYTFFDLATNHLGRRSFFTTSDEQQWAAVRKSAAAAFNMANVRRSFPHVLKHATIIADQLAEKNAAHASSTSSTSTSSTSTSQQQGKATSTSGTEQQHVDGAVIDIQEYLELALLNVFVEALFEVDASEFSGHDVAHAMNLVLEEANERLKVPLRGLATWIAHPKWYQSVRKAQQLLGDTYGFLVDKMRERGTPPDGNTNLWACLARLKDPKTGAPLTREQLIPEVGAFMMAGFDTSSHTIAWCLYTLATYPEHQRRVHQELDDRGLLHGPGRSPRELQMDDLSQLPHLNCVIDETMRMYPVAATASVREVVKPVRVGPYTIPQGVIVWPMLYALHNSQHNWDSPRQFQPERWADKHLATMARTSGSSSSGEDSDVAASKPPSPTASSSPRPQQQAGGSKTGRAFLPFSDGIKNCLGQNLGLMEVRTVLVSLLSRFRFELHPDIGGPQQVEKNMIMSLTLKMKGGLRVVCHPLKQEAEYLAPPATPTAFQQESTTAPSLTLPSPMGLPKPYPDARATGMAAAPAGPIDEPEEVSTQVPLQGAPAGMPALRVHEEEQEPDMLLVSTSSIPVAQLRAQLSVAASLPDKDSLHIKETGFKQPPQKKPDGVPAHYGGDSEDSDDAREVEAQQLQHQLQQQQHQLQQLQQEEEQGGWEEGWLSAVKAQAKRMARGGALMMQREDGDEDLQVE